MTPHAPQTTAWVDVLEQIRTALEAALTATVARERSSPSEERGATVPYAVAQLEARIRRLRDLAEQARAQQAEQADALTAGEERLRSWLAEALAARQRLAEWASRSLG